MIECLLVITEDKKYMSTVFRNLGFTFFVPTGSFAYQFLVLGNSSFSWRIIVSFLVCLVGWILILVGYNYVREQKGNE